jgi:hypothetical protein
MNAYDNWIKFLESKGESPDYWKTRERQLIELYQYLSNQGHHS